MPVIDPVTPGAVFPLEEGPCTWPVDLSCVPDWETYSASARSAAVSWAAYILWALTGRQYGPCSITVRPCGPRCSGPSGYMTFPVRSDGSSGAMGPWMVPWIDAGVWRNCGCAGGCSCAADCEIALPGPVAAVDEVTVGGVTLPASAYRLDIVRGLPVLVRIDGECWPECQDMNANTDEPGSFAITYQRGVYVPRAGQLAAGQLAGEFAKACSGQDCALPQQLASLTRNGVEVQVVDPATFLDAGLTGLANVDMWIRAVNPLRKAQRARVYSSDFRGPRFAT